MARHYAVLDPIMQQPYHNLSTKIINVMTKCSGIFSHERSIGTKTGSEPMRLERHLDFHLRQALEHW